MVADIIPPTKTSGARPPFLPPGITTFSQEPDEDGRQDMLVFIRDSVDRLVREAKSLNPDSVLIFLALLDQRRSWIVSEMEAERMMESGPKAPLGIEEDPYDLSAINFEFEDSRGRQFRSMLELIDATRAKLEAQLPDLKYDS